MDEDQNREDHSLLIMVNMRVDDCPISPPRPGNFWLGYLPVPGEIADPDTWTIDSAQEWLLRKVKEDNFFTMLERAWIYNNIIELQKMPSPEDPSKFQVGVNHIGVLFPVCDHSDHRGCTITVPISNWIWPTGTMKDEMISLISQAGRKLIQARSSLAVVGPESAPPDLRSRQ